METKEYSNILTYLSLSNLKLPILSSYFFANNTCQKAFFNNAEYMVEKSALRIGGLNTLLVSLYKEYERFTSLKTQYQILCVVYTYNTQKYLTCQSIKSVLEGKEAINSVLCLQKLKIGFNERLTYCIKLCVSGIKYKYKFFSTSKGTFIKCEEISLKVQAKTLSKLVTQVLLKHYKTSISDLQIDFISDSNNKLYIKFIKLSQSSKIPDSLDKKPIILSSSDSSQDLSHPPYSKSQKNFTLKRCSTLSSRKVFRNKTENKNFALKKQLTTIISKNYESENEESKESLESDSSEDEVDDDFFEIIAREKCKKQYQAMGKVGKMTPDNEVLMKEMKIVKKSITCPKLPDIYTGSKARIEKTRKTLPYIRIPGKNLGSLKNSLTKN